MITKAEQYEYVVGYDWKIAATLLEKKFLEIDAECAKAKEAARVDYAKILTGLEEKRNSGEIDEAKYASEKSKAEAKRDSETADAEEKMRAAKSNAEKSFDESVAAAEAKDAEARKATEWVVPEEWFDKGNGWKSVCADEQRRLSEKKSFLANANALREKWGLEGFPSGGCKALASGCAALNRRVFSRRLCSSVAWTLDGGKRGANTGFLKGSRIREFVSGIVASRDILNPRCFQVSVSLARVDENYNVTYDRKRCGAASLFNVPHGIPEAQLKQLPGVSVPDSGSFYDIFGDKMLASQDLARVYAAIAKSCESNLTFFGDLPGNPGVSLSEWKNPKYSAKYPNEASKYPTLTYSPRCTLLASEGDDITDEKIVNGTKTGHFNITGCSGISKVKCRWAVEFTQGAGGIEVKTKEGCAYFGPNPDCTFYSIRIRHAERVWFMLEVTVSGGSSSGGASYSNGWDAKVLMPVEASTGGREPESGVAVGDSGEAPATEADVEVDLRDGLGDRDDFPHGDLDRIIIDGEIWTKRSGLTGKKDRNGNDIPSRHILRGEDIAFAMEYLAQRDSDCAIEAYGVAYVGYDYGKGDGGGGQADGKKTVVKVGLTEAEKGALKVADGATRTFSLTGDMLGKSFIDRVIANASLTKGKALERIQELDGTDGEISEEQKSRYESEWDASAALPSEPQLLGNEAGDDMSANMLFSINVKGIVVEWDDHTSLDA